MSVLEFKSAWSKKARLVGDPSFDDLLLHIDAWLSPREYCKDSVKALVAILEGGLSSEYRQDESLLSACVRQLRVFANAMLTDLGLSPKLREKASEAYRAFEISEVGMDFLELVLTEREILEERAAQGAQFSNVVGLKA